MLRVLKKAIMHKTESSQGVQDFSFSIFLIIAECFLKNVQKLKLQNFFLLSIFL